MPRYIDAEALMQKLCKQCGVKDREYFCHAHCGDRMNIEDIPTADVQPVKHGRWERRMTKIYACSECTNEVTDRQRKNYSFCPYCGSKQDLGGD